MLTGTVAAPLLLPNVTKTPPGPAGADMVTVPVDGDPPGTGLGDRVKPVIVPCPGPWPPPGLIVRVALSLLLDVAVIRALVTELTAVVLTVKVPLVWPAGIVMLAGSVAAPLLLVSVTDTPFGPAGEARITVPIEGEPPVTGLGESKRLRIVP